MIEGANGDWQYAHVGTEGDDARIGGVAIWSAEWKRAADAPVMLPHPSHISQRHRYWIYEAAASGKHVRFAAGELSPNVWGFYIPFRP